MPRVSVPPLPVQAGPNPGINLLPIAQVERASTLKESQERCYDSGDGYTAVSRHKGRFDAGDFHATLFHPGSNPAACGRADIDVCACRLRERGRCDGDDDIPLHTP